MMFSVELIEACFLCLSDLDKCRYLTDFGENKLHKWYVAFHILLAHFSSS